MIAEPLVFTIGGVDSSLVKINQDNYSSEWFLDLGDSHLRAFVRNTTYKDKSRGGKVVERHNIELRQTYHGTPPAFDTIYKSYFVMEADRGSTLATSIARAAALMVRLTASSNALLIKIGGNES